MAEVEEGRGGCGAEGAEEGEGTEKAEPLPPARGNGVPEAAQGGFRSNAVKSLTAAPGLLSLAAAVAGVRGIMCGDGIMAPTSMSGSEPSSHSGLASPPPSGVVDGHALGLHKGADITRTVFHNIVQYSIVKCSTHLVALSASHKDSNRVELALHQ